MAIGTRITAKEAKDNADSVSSRNGSILTSIFSAINNESRIGKYQATFDLIEDSTYVSLRYIESSLVALGYDVTIMYDSSYTPPAGVLICLKQL